MTGAPSSTHAARYSPDNSEHYGDGRLVSPVFERNSPPLIAALAPWLAGAAGPALELGSGTGQHAAALALAFPGLDWHPSDPDPLHRRSCAAWRAHLRLPVRAARDLDAAGDWPSTAADLGPLRVVLAMNVCHIAPERVTEGIVAGAGRALGRGGLLILYGPFREPGRPLGPGNAAFDERLRADTPEWGLRNLAWIDGLADDAGLTRAGQITMPADNRLVLWRA